MRTGSRRLALPLWLGGLALLGWLLLAWLLQSPAGALLHVHGGLHQAHVRAGAAPSLPVAAALFIVGWLIMTIAMMLPATLPFAVIFQKLVARRSNSSVLVALLVSGYLLAWLAFGAVAWLAATLVAARLAESPGWAVSASTFILAGAFQFSPLKYQCLERCRAPLGFILNRWHGARPRSEAMRIGFSHGVFCVGCCWALMLVMFAVSTASLVWMLLLGVLMAIEKNARWGRRLVRPLGYVLLSAGFAIALLNVLARD